MNRRHFLSAAAVVAMPASALAVQEALVWTSGLRKLERGYGYSFWVRATRANGSYCQSAKFWPATRQPCTPAQMIDSLFADVRGLLACAVYHVHDIE